MNKDDDVLQVDQGRRYLDFMRKPSLIASAINTFLIIVGVFTGSGIALALGLIGGVQIARSIGLAVRTASTMTRLGQLGFDPLSFGQAELTNLYAKGIRT